MHRPVGLVVKDIGIAVEEVGAWIPEPVKSDTMSPTVSTASPFFRRCVAQALSRGDGPGHSVTLRHNIASLMKVDFDLKTEI